MILRYLGNLAGEGAVTDEHVHWARTGAGSDIQHAMTSGLYFLWRAEGSTAECGILPSVSGWLRVDT